MVTTTSFPARRAGISVVSTTDPDTFDVPQEHALLVVDMKGYSKIPEAKMAPVRADLDDILATVFAHSGLDGVRSRHVTYKDTGDGGIFVLPARHTARLVVPLLGELNDALARYDTMRLASAPPLLLRASVHVGPLAPPEHRGDAINDACRLVDSDVARQAMTAAADNGSFLAAVISEPAFRRSVRAGRTPGLNERQFLNVTARVRDKPEFEETCWVTAPRVAPATISVYLLASDDDGGEDSGSTAQPAGSPSGSPQDHTADDRPASIKQKGKASGEARLIQVGGNYTTSSPEES
jgi:hypothetical protein